MDNDLKDNICSMSDKELFDIVYANAQDYTIGAIEIAKEERHRIIGTDKHALVAEIWIHTDKDNPSDEEDIVRVQDDFDRK